MVKNTCLVFESRLLIGRHDARRGRARQMLWKPCSDEVSRLRLQASEDFETPSTLRGAAGGRWKRGQDREGAVRAACGGSRFPTSVGISCREPGPQGRWRRHYRGPMSGRTWSRPFAGWNGRAPILSRTELVVLGALMERRRDRRSHPRPRSWKWLPRPRAKCSRHGRAILPTRP
jgi:hypothetical protein